VGGDAVIDSDRPISYVPSTPVIAEVLEQAVTELDRQQRDGWHLVDIEERVGEDEFGRPVMMAARYLETGS